MTVYGPTTKDTTTIALGLAEIRIGSSSSNINSLAPALTGTNSLGAMANTKFTGTVDYWRLESGFPLVEDATYPLREKAQMEVAFREITPMNLAFAKGIDATSGYTLAHSGEVGLGQAATPSFIRMEAFYTYPDLTNEMVVIFPRAQITSSVEVDFKTEEGSNVPIVIEAKRADSGVSGGSSIWNSKPLGRFLWRPKP